MTSNLPPGVTDSMIPGNRSEDVLFEEYLEGDVGDVLYELAMRGTAPDAIIGVLEKLRDEMDRLPGDPLI